MNRGRQDGCGNPFKDGGGLHSDMRLYQTKGIVSVVMVNSTEFNDRVEN